MNDRTRKGLANLAIAVAAFLIGLVMSGSTFGGYVMFGAFVVAIVGLVQVAWGLMAKPEPPAS